LAVSGGADSLALLRVFVDLRSELIVLSIVHFQSQAARQGVGRRREVRHGSGARGTAGNIHLGSGDVAALASAKRLSLETAAREMRYDFFESSCGQTLTALSDRTKSLPATPSMTRLRPCSCESRGERAREDWAESTQGRTGGRIWEAPGEVVRPLLSIRRHELEQFLQDLGQSWREDSSNRDPKFTPQPRAPPAAAAA